jgi:hypothetical protein
MFLLLAIGAVVALCALLWRVAIYALPVFIGFSVGFWALAQGAGVGAIAVGLFAGILSWELAKHTIDRSTGWAQAMIIAVFVVPAAYMGFEIVWQTSADAVPSLIWRAVLGMVAGLASGGTTLRRLSEWPLVR